MKAIWNDQIIDGSDVDIVIEGNHYLPPESVSSEYLVESTTVTESSWKGEASYYDIVVDDRANKDEALYCPSPKEKASEIRDYVAFWRGVQITS